MPTACCVVCLQAPASRRDANRNRLQCPVSFAVCPSFSSALLCLPSQKANRHVFSQAVLLCVYISFYCPIWDTKGRLFVWRLRRCRKRLILIALWHPSGSKIQDPMRKKDPPSLAIVWKRSTHSRPEKKTEGSTCKASERPWRRRSVAHSKTHISTYQKLRTHAHAYIRTRTPGEGTAFLFIFERSRAEDNCVSSSSSQPNHAVVWSTLLSDISRSTHTSPPSFPPAPSHPLRSFRFLPPYPVVSSRGRSGRARTGVWARWLCCWTGGRT